MLGLLPLLLTFSSMALADSDVWRWKDANGNYHYSDVPIDGAEMVKSGHRVPPPPAPASPSSSASSMAPSARPATAAARAAAGSQQASEQLAQAAAERQVQQDVAKTQAGQCEEAKKAYDKSVAARRLYREVNGQRVYLTDAELDKARLEALNARNLACGSGSGTP
jgi:galactitol-specific phosphotransferase system IIB component